jgi:hypothetical protein
MRYEWRELTPDGLLKKPSKEGPHYDPTDLNQWGGFDTIDGAIRWMEECKSMEQFYFTDDYVLVKIY